MKRTQTLDQRTYGRIPVESLCTEVSGDHERYSLVVDLSAAGLRLQRPHQGHADSRIVQLEFELPEADEMVWAKGLICFDQLWRVPLDARERQARVVRTSGVRVVAAAARHLRMLRDYVVAATEAAQRCLPAIPGPRELAAMYPF
jgi:hypothetical protein